MASSHDLAVALVIIYSLLLLPVAFVLLKHGTRHGAVFGWLYLLIFCSLRIISSGLTLSDPTSSGAAIVANVGLSPLLLAAAGILHQARAYLCPDVRRAVETIWYLTLHLVVSTAIALVAAGAAALASPTADAGDMQSAATLVKVGMVLLLLGAVFVVGLAVLTLVVKKPGHAREGDRRGGRILLFAVLVAMPVWGIRLLKSFVYFFSDDADLGPTTASVGVTVGLEVVEEVLVTLIFVGAGVVTRNIGKAKGSPSKNRDIMTRV
ncbi:hypothetical protein F4780DRAFT_688951 [Xylariomycetidae sp. FL0641]|nr:hypothetical protein F4780DRAFT_688951 [Xylariomycetidae sp. FL0641]